MSEILTREQVNQQDRWNIKAFYANDQLWQEAFVKAESLSESIAKYKGMLGQSAQVVAKALSALFDARRQIDKLYTYSHLRHDEDLSNSHYQVLHERAQKLYYDFEASVAFIEPELLALDQEILEQFMSDASLKPYRVYTHKLLRRKPHTLSQEQEQLLALVAEPLSSNSRVFSMLNNVDMPTYFGKISDEEQRLLPLTHANYARLMESRNRAVRRETFHNYFKHYNQHRNTLAAALEGQIKANIFMYKARNYTSAREAALFPDQVSVTVYDNLIETTHQHLADFYRYVQLRQHALDLSPLHIYDMRVPIVSEIDLSYTWEEAEALICDALMPLGQEYQQILRGGLRDGWIDRYENRGKRSGAYSSGCYDSMPYILHNYNNTLQSVYTLAHELGHSIHTAFANRTQPYHTAEYRIFVAEVASTTNEALLTHHLLQKIDDPRIRAYIINNHLEDFRGTMFRQTMFAEFEREIYAAVESGSDALTADFLDQLYYRLNKLYFGDGLAWNDEDLLVAGEWSRIPHFYYNFYVYKYSTGMAAAVSLAHQIIAEGQPAVDRYLDFLRAGGSDDPLVLLQKAGVDLTSPKPIVDALASFCSYLDELTTLLG